MSCSHHGPAVTSFFVAPLRPQSSHCRTVLSATMSCFDKVLFAPYVPRRVATSATLSCQKPRPCQHSFSSNQPSVCFFVPHFVIMSCLFAVVAVVFLKASVRMGYLQHMYVYVPALFSTFVGTAGSPETRGFARSHAVVSHDAPPPRGRWLWSPYGGGPDVLYRTMSYRAVSYRSAA